MTIMRSILVGELPLVATSSRLGATRVVLRKPAGFSARTIATGRFCSPRRPLVMFLGTPSALRLCSVGIRNFATEDVKKSPAPDADDAVVGKPDPNRIPAATAASSSGKSAETTAAAVVETKPKLTIWEKVKKEAKHYWDGTKLLGYELRVSFKLVLKMASGRELTRREDRQLKRTVQDMARLVPFSVFVLVPFAELLLPIALKIFPNLLPSTYESKSGREKKLKQLGKTRGKVGTYLRDMVNGAKIVPNPKTEEQKQAFDTFMAQVKVGERPDSETTLKVAQLFKDDMLLDNFSRPELAALSRYMNMTPIGTSTVLRYALRHRMRQVKQDDYIIDREGVDSLNAQELQSACLSRGFKVIGVSIGRQRSDLSMWLQLRLKDRVPSTILVLSSAYTYGSHDLESFYDGVTAVLSALPSEVYHEAELDVVEDNATNQQRLEVLKEQQDKIMEENKENEESGQNIQVRDHLNVDEPADTKAADVPDDTPEAMARADYLREHPIPTESEEDVAADRSSIDPIELSRKQKSDVAQPTESEQGVRADANPVDPIKMAEANYLRRNPEPTTSEEDVKADMQSEDPLKSSRAQQARRNPPRTTAEEDVDADQSSVDPLKSSRAQQARRNPPRTTAEEDVDADQSSVDPLKSSRAEEARRNPPRTTAEEDVDADQSSVDPLKSSRAEEARRNSS
ncbi:LETM1 domain-containing protein YLH47, mitochondrial [Wickerhamiella sorbophila]|uniref:LETM1 domain-containing protein YLH47, mitochondrial n=1 Tax=Wickerhamiella sorbophila TaxID=45607 RepID=A0A2T0FHA6_9ASCO|nr:LETM1 domain-containing protein YLH47, mitochondrial [Wickerhamiella sorbophila]PRT54382.1 LETM1 domain-containing protein YLH47, mitochondrial [Wickerhamiella sorbophila]